MQPFRKEPPPPKRERVILKKEDFPNIPEETLEELNKMDETMMMRLLSARVLEKGNPDNKEKE